MCIHINKLSKVTILGMIMLPIRMGYYLTKTSENDMKILPSPCWSEKPKRMTN